MIEPAINTDVFLETVSYHYWSASPVAYNSSRAWVVYFDYGYGYWNYKNNGYFVRLVRNNV